MNTERIDFLLRFLGLMSPQTSGHNFINSIQVELAKELGVPVPGTSTAKAI